MKKHFPVFCAFLAAALYALNAPVSKALLQNVPPTMMAAFLYLGAGTGMILMGAVQKRFTGAKAEKRLGKKDLPYAAAMIVLDVLAPVFLMMGLKRTTAENASLINNFEIVATSLVALFLFREKISRRLWIAIGLITLSSALLSVEDVKSLSFSEGSAFVLAACVCWGFENNMTRMMSQSDPREIVVVKGLGSGAGALVTALVIGENFVSLSYIACVMALGFVAYGLSIYFYVYAQRYLGAAKTSACYAVQPFIGAALSLIFFRQLPGLLFYPALILMIMGTYFLVRDQRE